MDFFRIKAIAIDAANALYCVYYLDTRRDR